MVADATIRPSLSGLFAGLLPAEVIAAYDRLVASDGCARDEAGSLIGNTGLRAAAGLGCLEVAVDEARNQAAAGAAASCAAGGPRHRDRAAC